jgi:hypothetical protein
MKDEHETAAPLEIAVEFMLTFAPDVPTDMSIKRAPEKAFAEMMRVAHVAVLVAFALESDVIAFADLLAAAAAANAVTPKAKSARSTCAPSAVSASVGCAPSAIMNFPLFNVSKTALRLRFRPAADVFGLSATA